MNSGWPPAFGIGKCSGVEANVWTFSLPCGAMSVQNATAYCKDEIETDYTYDEPTAGIFVSNDQGSKYETSERLSSTAQYTSGSKTPTILLGLRMCTIIWLWVSQLA